MWKPAAAVIIVTMAGATAHAQQQQSPIENLDKTISELAQEGYEIKAAEDLSGIYRNLFCRKQKVSLFAKLTSQMEKKTVSSLGRGGGDGLNQAVNRRSEFVDGRPPTPQIVTVEVDRLP